MKNHKSIKL